MLLLKMFKVLEFLSAWGDLLRFSVPGGTDELLSFGLIGGSVPRLTLFNLKHFNIKDFTIINFQDFFHNFIKIQSVESL